MNERTGVFTFCIWSNLNKSKKTADPVAVNMLAVLSA